MTFPPALPWIGVVIAAMLSSGCAAPRGGIHVVAAIDANNNNATSIDLVYVYDPAAQAALPRSGPQWFASKPALAAALAQSIDVVSLQIPPATIVQTDKPRNAAKAIAVYAYPNYIATAGQPRADITPYACVQISLLPESVVYRPCD